MFRPTLLALLLFAAPVAASPVRVVVFGDSLSDTGNVYRITSGGIPASPPYFAGRFSNGPVFVEVLAQQLGLAAPTPSLLGGTNYAWGGAETGVFSTVGVPGVLLQVNQFLGASGPQPGDLISLLAGSNDILNGVSPLTAATNLAAAVQALAAAGARDFLIGNVPAVGTLPVNAALTPAQQAALNAQAAALNTLFDARLAQLQQTYGLTLYRLDVAGLLAAARANPAAFGLTNVTTGALNDGVLSGQGYLFWDNFHPTASIHRTLGLQAAALIPEPGTLALVGLIGLGVFARRRAAKGERPA